MFKNLKIKNAKFFAKGKRGYIYVGDYKGIKVAIKVKNPSSKAENRIENEAYWLKKLNKYGIGPKFYFLKENALVYRFVEGQIIKDWLKKSKKEEKKKALLDILKQLKTMDKLKINKLEMHKPLKHIVINKKPVLIDFERCYRTNKPKNVTQFFQFLIQQDLINKNKPLIGLLSSYKRHQSDKNFNKIIKYFLEIFS
ncbi:MAG: hypothetical protein HYS32_02245 [Candidatus Woesearchaeota archaeon]|nr:MAG: hypothetical protein HYS32_02245 [Candidatus Woesearchaeota archaeon]